MLDIVAPTVVPVFSDHLLLLGLDFIHFVLGFFLSLFDGRVDVVILGTFGLLDGIIVGTEHFDVFGEEVYFAPEFLHQLALGILGFPNWASFEFEGLQRASKGQTVF